MNRRLTQMKFAAARYDSVKTIDNVRLSRVLDHVSSETGHKYDQGPESFVFL